MRLAGRIIAVDFDGTCVTHKFPLMGREVGAAPVLRRFVQEGARIILWTMRSGSHLRAAEQWFSMHRIPLFGVNRNPEQDWTDSPKAYAHLYIDDAALGAPLRPGLPGERPFVDWVAVQNAILPGLSRPAAP